VDFDINLGDIDFNQMLDEMMQGWYYP
jgi:hypothetical protein